MKTRALKQTCVIIALLGTSWGAHAQSVIDGSDTAIGSEETARLLAVVGQRLRSPDAKVAGLHKGRAGALCGTVEVRNRMGTYTGPRAFVANLAEGFFGRLPEGPELRAPASMADFQAMERAKSLFAENCSER